VSEEAKEKEPEIRSVDAVSEKAARDAGNAAIAAEPGKTRIMVAAWLDQHKESMRAITCRLRISEAIDGKAHKNSKSLLSDQDRVRIALAELSAILSELPAPSAPEVKP
jgi:hypothetical protein